VKVPAPDFSASTAHTPFPGSLQSAFLTALSNEFEAFDKKMGWSAAVYQNGMLWSDAIGLANESTPMTTSTPMAIMSTSKTFLSALILSQVDDGLYALDDLISVLLADHSDYQSADKSLIPDATVEQLLRMASGVQEVSKNSIEAYLQSLDPNWKPSDLFTLVSGPPIPPGTHNYTTPSSFLVGLVAEHKGGDNLHALYQSKFFEPLSLNAGLLPHIQTPANMPSTYADLAAYGGDPGWGNVQDVVFYRDLDYWEAEGRRSWAAAGMISTPESIARWGYELFSPNGSAVSANVRQQLIGSFRDPTQKAGGPWLYGMHIAMKEQRLSDGTIIETYGHPGGGSGATSALFYVPLLDLAIALQANTEDIFQRATCAGRGGLYSDEPWLSPSDCVAREIINAVNDQ
jgi:CubicO group peptidase (beta-lactamase class C family)